jgi:hypothetical protein
MTAQNNKRSYVIGGQNSGAHSMATENKNGHIVKLKHRGNLLLFLSYKFLYLVSSVNNLNLIDLSLTVAQNE